LNELNAQLKVSEFKALSEVRHSTSTQYRYMKQHICFINYSVSVLCRFIINPTLKVLCLHLLGQNRLHLTFYRHLGSETYSRKYEKLPNTVINACNNITENMNLLKMCGLRIWRCLFTFYMTVTHCVENS